MERIEQLSRDAWLDEAMRVLASEGAPALRAEPLAKRLGVSRGSFYWHFEDVGAFHAAVLERWETIAVDRPYEAATRTSANDAILRMIKIAFGASLDLERAVHSWAMTSPAAKTASHRVNQRRVSLLAKLFREAGLKPSQARLRAVALYWTYLGRVISPDLAKNPNVLIEIQLLYGHGLPGSPT